DFEVVVVEPKVAAAAVVGSADVKADAADVAGGDFHIEQREQNAVKLGGIHPPEGPTVTVGAVFTQHIKAELGTKLTFVHNVGGQVGLHILVLGQCQGIVGNVGKRAGDAVETDLAFAGVLLAHFAVHDVDLLYKDTVDMNYVFGPHQV